MRQSGRRVRAMPGDWAMAVAEGGLDRGVAQHGFELAGIAAGPVAEGGDEPGAAVGQVGYPRAAAAGGLAGRARAVRGRRPAARARSRWRSRSRARAMRLDSV